MITRRGIYLQHRSVPAPAASVELERDGYTVLRNVFSSTAVADLRADIERVFDDYAPDPRGPDPEAWAMFRYEMLNRSAVCIKSIAHRAILDVIEPLLGEDCHVIANTAWRNPPSSETLHGGHHWHIDSGPHIPLADGMQWPSDIPHPVFALGAHIYLQPCDLHDGPTGVIPGSHLSGRPPPADRLLDDDLTFNGSA